MGNILQCCMRGSSSAVLPQDTPPMTRTRNIAEGEKSKEKASDDVSVLSRTSGSVSHRKSLTERFSNSGNSSSEVPLSKSMKSPLKVNGNGKKPSIRQGNSRKSYVIDEYDDEDEEPLEEKHSKYCMCGCRSF